MRKLLILGLAGVIAVLAGVFLNRWQTRPEADPPSPSAEITQRPAPTPAAVAPAPTPPVPTPTPPAPTPAVRVDGSAPEAAPPSAPVPHPPPAAEAPPPAPLIAAASAAPDRARFEVVRIDHRGEAVIAGHARNSATVTVSDGDQVIGSTSADGRGEWVMIPDTRLTPGARLLTLQVQDRQQAPIIADQVVLVILPETPGVFGRPLAIAAPRRGGASQLLQGPGAPERVYAASEPATGLVSIDLIDGTAQGRFAVAGRARAGSVVRLYLDNTAIASAEVDTHGQWQIEPGQSLPPPATNTATARLRADQINEAGRVTARVEIELDLADLLPPTLPARGIDVRYAADRLRLARDSEEFGPFFTLVFAALPTQQRDPDLIYPGQSFIAPRAQN